jgi:hypothetical protein
LSTIDRAIFHPESDARPETTCTHHFGHRCAPRRGPDGAGESSRAPPVLSMSPFGAALAWAIDLRLRGIDLSGQKGDGDAENVAEILKYFKLGAGTGLRADDAGTARALEAEVPWTRRLFYWEGHGLGVCGRHACLFAGGNPLPRFCAPGYRLMFWTGLGFWNGVASPFPAVSVAPERWADVPEFEGEYSLLLGGSGFSTTTAAGRVDPEALSRLPGIRDDHDLRGVYRGVGRALWFLFMHNPERLHEILAQHPQHARPIREGLGIAITYTQLATPDRVFRDFAALPSEHWTDLVSGARVAMAGLLMEDPRTLPEVERLPEPFPRLLAEARQSLSTVAPGPGWDRRLERESDVHNALWDGLVPREPALQVAR